MLECVVSVSLIHCQMDLCETLTCEHPAKVSEYVMIQNVA